MFAIREASKAKIKNVTVLSQKNRALDEEPGAKLKLAIPLTLKQLEELMPGITKERYVEVRHQPKQAQLDGVETPPSYRFNDLGLKISKMTFGQEFTGYKLTIVRGTGRAESNLVMTDCLISKDSTLVLYEQGAGLWNFDIESGNVSEKDWGKFARLKSTDAEVLLDPPEVKQQDIERAAIPPAPTRKPGPAERAAVAKVKGVDPVPPTPHKGTAKPPRTARGKAQTKAALAAGTAAMASAGNAEPGKPTDAWPFPNQEKASAKAAAATDAFAQHAAGKTH